MKDVYLIQPNYHSVFDNKINYWFPYSVAVIWGYAIQNPLIKNNFNLKGVFYKRTPIETATDSVTDDSIFIFSNYIWNFEYNKALANSIKMRYPNSVILFGGPQITNRPLETGFFKEHPYVNSIILNEGEIAFENFLLDFLQGKIKKIYQADRINDLSQIPSPYLTGIFDHLFIENPDVTWNYTLETNRGCPYACTFCDWGSLTYSKVKKFPIERVMDEIEWMGQHDADFMFLTDANFGIFKDRDYLIAEKICEVKKKYNAPNNIGTNYAKNSTEKVVDIIDLFSSHGLSRGMTVSFQSMDGKVLESIKRKNMDINNAEKIFNLLEERQLNYYSEMIIGMPEESLESWKEGMLKLISSGQHQCIDVFFTSILENSELNVPSEKEKYGIETITTYYSEKGLPSADLTGTSDVLEKTDIISGTNTMSNSELIEAFMFSWIIVNFHSYGWSQIYARFLNAQGITDYRNFYNRLSRSIMDHEMDELSEIYWKYTDRLKLYFSDNQEFIRRRYNQDLMRDAQKYFYQEMEKVGDLIYNFVKQNFNCDLNMLDNLRTVQDHFMTSYHKKYPYTVKLDIAILNTILYNDKYEEKIVPVVVDIPNMFLDKAEFERKLWDLKRNGFGKTKITEVKDA